MLAAQSMANSSFPLLSNGDSKHLSKIPVPLLMLFELAMCFPTVNPVSPSQQPCKMARGMNLQEGTRKRKQREKKRNLLLIQDSLCSKNNIKASDWLTVLS